MKKKEQLLRIFPLSVGNLLRNLEIDFEVLQEIRLRIQAPMILRYENREYYLSKMGQLCVVAEEAYIVTRTVLKETLELVGNYSLYAYEEELRQGFLTIQGGHRIGIAGKTILDKKSVRGMKYISFMNIRICHEIKGCADKLLPYLFVENKMMQTLIISPPRCGKTTLLRDVIRQISNSGMTVGVVDERSELGACYMGEPQNDVGIRTDILDCCPKAEGMMMLIRTMAPEVIAVDEIGSREDLEAMEYVVNSGAKLIATVHGSSIEDIRSKPILRNMVEQKLFDRYVVLDNQRGIGTIEWIFDNMGNPLFREEEL